jgi:large subunit ribosomal protein L11
MKQVISALVDGGQATGGPPLGPSLGPLGLNIGEVISTINQKTKDFRGMKVPVKVIVDPATKAFEVEVGTPTTSALILQELGLEKGSGETPVSVAGDLSLQGALKVARMKKDGMLAASDKAAVMEVLGTCVSMGVTVEGRRPQEVQKEISQGKHDGLFEA